MSLPAPKPLSISTSPSQAPAAARVAAQDAQIAQLVQQVRALEHTLAQQRTQLDTEKQRGVVAVSQIRDQWRAESKEWRDGCDALQSQHRLAHLGTRAALEHERELRLEDKEELLREKIARLLREHKITLFQARETDLVAQVAALEEEIEAQHEQIEQLILQHEAEVAQFTMRLEKSDALREERMYELRGSSQEKKEMETQLTTLRATAASNAKQIERLTLQVDTLRTQNATNEDRNRELQHQVDKWQSLEGKGEKEVVELRKRRLELEVRVKELEVSLKETRGFEKKIAKLEASLLETQEQVEQGNQDIGQAQSDAELAKKQAVKLERQVAKLEDALEAEKARSHQGLEKEREKTRALSKPSSSKGRLQVPSAVPEVSENSEDEIFEAPVKPPSRRQRPASVRSDAVKGKEKAVQQHPSGSDVEQRNMRHKNKEDAKENLAQEVEEDEVREVPPPSKPNRTSHVEPKERDSDVEEIPSPRRKKPSSKASKPRLADQGAGQKPRSNNGKAKASDTDDQKQESRPRKRVRSKPASAGVGKKLSVEASESGDEDEQPQKKKKRKLNLTGGSGVFPGPAGFTWNQDGTDMDIPSELSPVKDGQPIPPRSGSGSFLGGWKQLWNK